MSTKPERRTNIAKARGVALKKARKFKNLTAEKLIEMAKFLFPNFSYSSAAVYAYESGRVLLSEEVARVFARVLGVEISALLVGPTFIFDEGPVPMLNISSHMGIGTQVTSQSWEMVYDRKRDRLVISTQSGNLVNLHIVFAGSPLKITPDLRNGNRGYINGFQEIAKQAIERGEDYPLFVTVDEGVTAKEIQFLLREGLQQDQQSGNVRDVLLGGGRHPVILGVG